MNDLIERPEEQPKETPPNDLAAHIFANACALNRALATSLQLDREFKERFERVTEGMK